jgi:hypothetical protein
MDNMNMLIKSVVTCGLVGVAIMRHFAKYEEDKYHRELKMESTTPRQDTADCTNTPSAPPTKDHPKGSPATFNPQGLSVLVFFGTALLPAYTRLKALFSRVGQAVSSWLPGCDEPSADTAVTSWDV